MQEIQINEASNGWVVRETNNFPERIVVLQTAADVLSFLTTLLTPPKTNIDLIKEAKVLLISRPATDKPTGNGPGSPSPALFASPDV